MTFGEIDRELNRVREEEGEEAHNRMCHGLMGWTWGMAGGAMAGAALGSVVPVVGPPVGAVVGGVAGLVMGVQDETALDNAKTLSRVVRRAISMWNS
jgi:hypothetical protein